jgi:hypothetical protein
MTLFDIIAPLLATFCYIVFLPILSIMMGLSSYIQTYSLNISDGIKTWYKYIREMDISLNTFIFGLSEKNSTFLPDLNKSKILLPHNFEKTGEINKSDEN